MRSVELFAGAGGLAIGMAHAGFKHAAVIEWDKSACETFRHNQGRHSEAVEGWPVFQMDAREFDYSGIKGVDVVSGGPPCQPFSMGGKHGAHADARDMFPQAIRAVRELLPRAFIFENVKGLTRSTFDEYFSYIVLQLQHPLLVRRRGENWERHRSRLERHHSAKGSDATYNVLFSLLNAADFGVPQKRERVFFVGFRADIGVPWSFPKATHSELALLRSKWVSGDYWEEHRISRKRRPSQTTRERNLLARSSAEADGQRWQTTRDALAGLPDPTDSATGGYWNHEFRNGARSYVGHTGSRLDEPAKTLKAGHHGVPGGENMLIGDSGRLRYFTVREAARLQTFPDDYVFRGPWSEAMRQLGNAVPVRLAQAIAASVAAELSPRATDRKGTPND